MSHSAVVRGVVLFVGAGRSGYRDHRDRANSAEKHLSIHRFGPHRTLVSWQHTMHTHVPLMADEKKSYTSQEAQEILRRVTEKRSDERRKERDEIEHDDLLAAAQDAGLDPAEVEHAAAEFALDRERGKTAIRLRAEWRRGLFAHALTYLAVNTGLYLIAHAGAAGQSAGSWWAYVAGIWGAFLLLNIYGAVKEPTKEEIDHMVRREIYTKERAEERLRSHAERDARRAEASRMATEKRQGRQQRRDLKRAQSQQRKEVRDAFAQAVDKSVNAVLKVAAESLEAVADQVGAVKDNAKPETDFAKFVASKKEVPANRTVKSVTTESAAETPSGVRVTVDSAPTAPSVSGSAASQDELRNDPRENVQRKNNA